MKELFKLPTLLRDTAESKVIVDRDRDLTYDSYSAHAVVVFSHHRDVKVAIDDLKSADFELGNDWIALIAHNAQRYSWYRGLTVYNYFDVDRFYFGQVAREFFWRLFQKGKYLVSVSGTKQDVNAACEIMARRRSHAEVWHLK